MEQSLAHELNHIKTEDLLIIQGEEEELGRGNFGKVVLGFHKRNKVIAAKCSKFYGSSRKKKNLGKRIFQEVKHLQDARHENILSVIGWTKWAEGVAIIMEYMPGGNIWDLVSDPDVRISPLLKLCLCSDISNGIKHIHTLFLNAKLVHGDIKPENILLTKNLQCKIADFGGSKLAAETESMKSVVNRIQLLGENHITEIYAAPETLKHGLETELEHTHDIYSFSIVVYEILARSKPNHNLSKEVYEEFIKSGQRPPKKSFETLEKELRNTNREADATIIATLKTIMEECWSQEPSDRPEMLEVYKRINSLLSTFSKEDQDKAVQDALKNMEMFHPSCDNCETLTINKIALPEPNEAGISVSKRTLRTSRKFCSLSRGPVHFPLHDKLKSKQEEVDIILMEQSKLLVNPLPRDTECLEEMLATQRDTCAGISKTKSDCGKLTIQQVSDLATSSSAISSKENFDIQDKFAQLQNSCEKAQLLCNINLEKISLLLSLQKAVANVDVEKALLDKRSTTTPLNESLLEEYQIRSSSAAKIDGSFKEMLTNLEKLTKKLEQLPADLTSADDQKNLKIEIDMVQREWEELKHLLLSMQSDTDPDGVDEESLLRSQITSFCEDLQEFKASLDCDKPMPMNEEEFKELITRCEKKQKEVETSWKERYEDIFNKCEVLLKERENDSLLEFQQEYVRLQQKWKDATNSLNAHLNKLVCCKKCLKIKEATTASLEELSDEYKKLQTITHQSLTATSLEVISLGQVFSDLENLKKKIEFEGSRVIELESAFQKCKENFDSKSINDLISMTKQVAKVKNNRSALLNQVATLSKQLLELSFSLEKNASYHDETKLQEFKKELIAIKESIRANMRQTMKVDPDQNRELQRQENDHEAQLTTLKESANKLHSECKRKNSDTTQQKKLCEKLESFLVDLEEIRGMQLNFFECLKTEGKAIDSYDEAHQRVVLHLNTLFEQSFLAGHYDSLGKQKEIFEKLDKNFRSEESSVKVIQTNLIDVELALNSLCERYNMESKKEQHSIAGNQLMNLWDEITDQITLRYLAGTETFKVILEGLGRKSNIWPKLLLKISSTFSILNGDLLGIGQEDIKAETLLKRLEDGLTKFEAMMNDVKSKDEDEIPSEYDQISRANWLLAVQSVIDELELLKKNLETESLKIIDLRNDLDELKRSANQFEKISSAFNCTYSKHRGKEQKLKKKKEKFKEDHKEEGADDFNNNFTPIQETINELTKQIKDKEETVAGVLVLVRKKIEKNVIYKRKPRLSAKQSMPIRNDVNLDDLLCLKGEKGLLSKGKSGFIRAGFYKTYTPIAIKCSGFHSETKHFTAERISNEIEHFQHISHENIVRVIGWFERKDDNVGLIMEYLCGGNLLQLVENKAVNLKPLLCLRICIDIAAGLKYLHDLPPNGLVHGNMKTENVLLTDALHCKITGLGLANLYIDHSEAETIPDCVYDENEDSMIFVDPQLLNYRSTATVFSQDVYSYSVIIYEILSRRRPFKAPEERRSYKNVVLKGERPNISSIISVTNEYRQKTGYDGEVLILDTLSEMMKRCWAPTPSDRPLISRVKAELVDLKNKFETSDVLRDATNATKVLNPQPIFRDRRFLAPIYDYLTVYEPMKSTEAPRLQKVEDAATSLQPNGSSETASSSNFNPSDKISPSFTLHLPREEALHDLAKDKSYRERNRPLPALPPRSTLPPSPPSKSLKPKTQFCLRHDDFIGFNHEKVFVYNVGNKTSYELPKLQNLHERGSVLILQDSCFVMGGTNLMVEKLDFNKYFADWVATSRLNETRRFAASAVLNGKIYVTGGKTEHYGESNASTETFEIGANVWKLSSRMKECRRNHGLAAMKGKLFAVGGFQSNTAESFDPRQGSWSMIPPMNHKRYALATVALDDKLYAIGGWDGNDYLSSVERFDPTAFKWETFDDLKIKRCLHGAVALNGKIHVGGGRTTDDDYTLTIETYEANNVNNVFYPWTVEKDVAILEGALCFAA